jgi:hypothetical protein
MHLIVINVLLMLTCAYSEGSSAALWAATALGVAGDSFQPNNVTRDAWPVLNPRVYESSLVTCSGGDAFNNKTCPCTPPSVNIQ